MLNVAGIVGDTLSEVTVELQGRMERMSNHAASASLILAGQRKGGPMRMFLIYPEGNFIEATEDTPFLQIGEHKYGKPILDRVVTMDTTLAEAKKAVLLSMDSTLRSNLSVGMPLDMAVIEADALRVTERERIEAKDERFAELSAAWSQALRDAFQRIGWS
jgi:putative proteasome-type protease